MSATWEFFKENTTKKQVDIGVESTVMSSFVWTETGKPQLDKQMRQNETYDDHPLTLLGSLTCEEKLPAVKG